MPSNKAPLYLWRREPQACGAVRWFLHRGLKRTRWFVERPASAYDRILRSLPYVLCCMRLDRSGSAHDVSPHPTLEGAKMRAELEVEAWQ